MCSYSLWWVCRGTIASKINVTPKGFLLSISKLHSILALGIYLPIITKVKFVTGVKFHHRVLQFFWHSDTFGGNIYFAGDVHTLVLCEMRVYGRTF